MSRWCEGTVIENHHWHDTLFSLRVQAGGMPGFKAGQFTRLALPNSNGQLARPYSLVNAPGAPWFEFYANEIPGCGLSPQLNRLRAGDPILLGTHPTGFLVLDELSAQGQTLWLLATGTGIGPFLSMIQTEQPWQRFERVILLHAVRYQQDLAYTELIEQVRRRYPGQFIPLRMLSREPLPDSLQGRIPAAISNGKLEQAAGRALSARDSQVMLCGNPGMIRDALSALQARGLEKNLRKAPGQITMEKYW